MISENFVYFAAFLNLLGAGSYVLSTLRGQTKPNRVSWFIWGAAPLIAFSAQVGQGVGIQSLMTFMTGFGPLLVLTASFVNKQAYWKLTRLDMTCGALSLLGLALWGITREGNLAIIFAILADGLAAAPTVVKSYKAPETENDKAFLLSGLSALIVLFTIKDWTFEQYAFPVYIFLICALLFTLIRFKLGKKVANPTA
jgi:hypothetical protein